MNPLLTAPPKLRNGDRLTQAEFHRRYAAYDGDMKFELIGGIVYMASPVSRLHGLYHKDLTAVLERYEEATAGVEVSLETTNILGEESEPEPDITMRILTECGGQSRVTEDGFYEGRPELLVEVAYSSVNIDLHQKRADYERAGVQEYIVLCIEERELRWFDFAAGGEITANRKSVFCSRVFPGLWIHGESLLDRDSPRVKKILRQGLASRAHTAFVKRLQRQRRRGTSSGG